MRVIVQGQHESLQKQSSRDDEPREPVPKRARLLVRTDEKEQHSRYDREDETLEERHNDPRVFRFVRFLLEIREHTFWVRENALVSFRAHVAVEDDSRSVVVGADVRGEQCSYSRRRRRSKSESEENARTIASMRPRAMTQTIREE